MHELYVREQPGRPWLAVVLSIVLFVGSIVLAGIVVQKRQRFDLGPPVHPDEWAIEFRVPIGWRPSVVLGLRDEPAYRFAEFAKGRGGRQISVGRYQGGEADNLALLIAATFDLHTDSRIPADAPAMERMPVGSLPGLRLVLDDWRFGRGRTQSAHSFVIHAVTIGPDDAYIFAMHVSGPLRTIDWAIWEALATSIRPYVAIVFRVPQAPLYHRPSGLPVGAASRPRRAAHGRQDATILGLTQAVYPRRSALANPGRPVINNAQWPAGFKKSSRVRPQTCYTGAASMIVIAPPFEPT